MRITRVYHPSALQVNDTINLSSDAAGHLLRVLRLSEGAPIVLFNGDGNDYSAELVNCSKKSADARILSATELDVESGLKIHLGQGISRGEKMDFTIQKSVELGVREITPLITQRCGVKLNGDRWKKKQEHWQKVVISACEQSGRAFVPVVHEPVLLSDWLAQAGDELRLNLHPRANQRIADLRVPDAGIRLLIGPEGGLSDEEIQQASDQTFEEILLGPRVLRTETAALTTIAALQSHFGDI